MRALIVIGALTLAMPGCMSQTPASRETSGNDCAVIAAVAKEQYKFGPDNPALPLKASSADGWTPRCDWAKYGLSFSDYKPDPSADPRERLKYVEFQKPSYDGKGATLNTAIMHGPLAGMGYSCHVVSGFAGWTVEQCKMAWIS